MSNKAYRLGWGVAAVFALLFAASMSGIVQGGALDPPGAPGSTMKSLDDVPPAWHQTLSASGGCNSERFDCVLSDLAVLDRETGLVWDREPAATINNWGTSIRACRSLVIGTGSKAHRGWRLPTVEEFQSLIAFDDLPPGHPFTDVNPPTNNVYWTATTDAETNTNAVLVWLPNPSSGIHAKTEEFRWWCVRGGQGVDGQ